MSFQSIILNAVGEATPEQAQVVNTCLDEAIATNQSVVDRVLDLQIFDEETFLRGLAQQAGLEWVANPEPETTQASQLKRICTAQVGIRNRVIPLRVEFSGQDEETIQLIELAIYDPFQLQQRQAIQKALDCPISWRVTSRRRLLAGLQKFYGVGADTFEELLQNREVDDDSLDLREEVNVLDEDDVEASVVKFVNQILREALHQNATDIHVEPLENDLRIRYRIDGMLTSVPVPENIKKLQASVIARLKVMSRLDIAERRLPQDGRVHLQMDGQSIDVRVATIPVAEGESISLRLLGQEKFNLERLGLLSHVRREVDELLERPNGIVLVTGPTGSGKSTTLYCFLSVLNSEQRRIITVEDPVENRLEGVMQIAVKPDIDLTFARGLRSILRADPNVIMVGEIRDLETAEIAIRASLTGHLVLSTLHTNDAIGGITRLVDMGVEPFLVSASVRAFMAQRLVRRLCSHCRRPAASDPLYLRSVGVPESCWEGILEADPMGCEACNHSGYRGRLALYEVAVVTPELQEMVSRGSSYGDLFDVAVKNGYRTMRDYGWEKVASGDTSIEEVLSATDASKNTPI